MSAGNKGALSGMGSALVGGLILGLSGPFAALGFVGNLVAGLAIGAGMGGLGLLLASRGPKSKRPENDLNVTTSIRNLPVPVPFGRVRIAGNYICLGNFFRAGTKNKDNGARVYVMHSVIGLCEGPIKYLGNIRQGGKTLKELSEEAFEADIGNFDVDLILASDTDSGLADASGTHDELVPAFLSDFIENDGDERPFFTGLTQTVPWRNTAKLRVSSVIGGSPALETFNADMVGLDLTIRRTSTTSGTNFNEQIASDTVSNGDAFYDGYTQSIYYTVTTGSSGMTSPFGLSRIHRNNAAGHDFVQPPTSVSTTIKNAWYIGKHDILVMQDPNTSSTFYVGYWGITRGSSEWKTVKPHPGYTQAIAARHLDEMNTTLHTYHAHASQPYILRWNLLTGRVSKITTDTVGETCTSLCYSVGFSCYIFANNAGELKMIDAQSGSTFHTTTDPNLTNIKALCTSGARIGIIKVGGFLYYNPSDGSVSDSLGSSSTNVAIEGAMGGITACSQNTWTGQVLLGRYNSTDTTAEWNLFIPSIVEDLEDISAMGSPRSIEIDGDDYTVPEFQFEIDGFCAPIVPADNEKDWVRDWSWRTYDEFAQVSLEGNSSVAAAAYAAMVDYLSIDPTMVNLDGIPMDTARWGAGLDESLFNLPSFEALHAYCVGGIIMKGPQRTYSCGGESLGIDVSLSTSLSLSITEEAPDETEGTVERYAERAKFDSLLDGETSAAEFVIGNVLQVVNGFTYFENGQMFVGINLPGILPVWHFTEDQITENSGKVQFSSRRGGKNRIRVQFTDVRDEYRKNFAEWNDDAAQNAVGRVRMETLQIDGISRHGHAEWLVKQIGDQTTASRRTLQFDTYWLGKVLSAGDVIEVSHVGMGLSRDKFKITQMYEQEDGSVQITGQEYRPILENLRDEPLGSPNDPNNDKACTGCGDEFEFITGDVAEHSFAGGTSVFVRSSEIFKVCTLDTDAVLFSGTSDDFVILTAAGDKVLTEYSGIAGDPVTLTLPEKYVIFRNTAGSLRATASVEKTLTDGTNTSVIPAGEGSEYDQVEDVQVDGFDTQEWETSVLVSKMEENGWINVDGIATLRFHHIVCGRGFATITGFTCDTACVEADIDPAKNLYFRFHDLVQASSGTFDNGDQLLSVDGDLNGTFFKALTNGDGWDSFTIPLNYSILTDGGVTPYFPQLQVDLDYDGSSRAVIVYLHLDRGGLWGVFRNTEFPDPEYNDTQVCREYNNLYHSFDDGDRSIAWDGTMLFRQSGVSELDTDDVTVRNTGEELEPTFTRDLNWFFENVWDESFTDDPDDYRAYVGVNSFHVLQKERTRWIAATPNGESPAASYDFYTRIFIGDSPDLSTLRFEIYVAAEVELTDIAVNDVSTGISVGYPDSSSKYNGVVIEAEGFDTNPFVRGYNTIKVSIANGGMTPLAMGLSFKWVNISWEGSL